MSPEGVTPDNSSVRTYRTAAKTLLVALLSVSLPLGLGGTARAARPPTTVSIADASVIELDEGSQNAISFRISASGAKFSGSLTVSYATADGTATAGSDYAAASGTATLPSTGCRCANVPVTILGDGTAETTETFVVNISNPSKGTIADGQAVGTIYDNEGTPGLVALDADVNESDGSVSLGVSLTGPSAQLITVAYATSDVTAAAGQDYTPATGALAFAPGETSKSVLVAVLPDVFDEDDETFQLDLSSAVNASILDGTAVATILDDDEVPALSIDDVEVDEGDAGTTPVTFTVTSEYAPVVDVTVDFAVLDGTAAAGSDYVAGSGTLTIPSDEDSVTVSVDVVGDADHEADETFSVVLSNPVESAIADDTGTGTILNDDMALTALTGKAAKRRSAVKAVGRLELAQAGLTVDVTLQKKKGSRWVALSTKTVTVKGVGDKDADGLTDAGYVASFPRPARGSYRFVVKFLGTNDFLSCSKTVSFKL
jgi:hypothetical protein